MQLSINVCEWCTYYLEYLKHYKIISLFLKDSYYQLSSVMLLLIVTTGTTVSAATSSIWWMITCVSAVLRWQVMLMYIIIRRMMWVCCGFPYNWGVSRTYTSVMYRGTVFSACCSRSGGSSFWVIGSWGLLRLLFQLLLLELQ